MRTATGHLGAVLVLGATCAAWAACSSGPGSNAPPALGEGNDGGGQDVTMPAEAGPDTSPTEGAPSSDGQTDSGHDATSDVRTVDVSVDAQPLLPCGPSPAWGQPVVLLTTPTADSTIFGGITNDELSMAWVSTTGGVVTAWYADRTSNTVAFGTAQALASTFGALAMDRVTLSGDGLRIAGVRADGSAFVAAKRAVRTGPFDTDDSAEFAGFAPDGSTTSTYASPLLSPDDQVFAYLLTSASDPNDLFLSGGPGWSKSISPGLPELARMNGQERRPTGMTLDELSLFYWDDVTASEKVVYLGGASAQFADFGAWKDAVPTGGCSRIYYSEPAASGAITIVYVSQSGM